MGKLENKYQELIDKLEVSNNSIKNLKEELNKTKKEYILLAENTKDLICLHTPEGKYVYISPSSEQIIGYHYKELLGKNYYNFFHPNELDKIKEINKGIITGNEDYIQHNFKKKNGEYIYLETVTIPIYDENKKLTNLLTSSRDISLRKEAENNVKEQYKFLLQILDQNPNPIFVKDKKGRYVLANKSLTTFFGKSNKEIIGKTDKQLIHKDSNVEKIIMDDYNVLKYGKKIFIPEEILTDQDGKEKYFQTIKTPIISENGEAQFVLGIANEITRVKEAENKAIHSRNILQGVMESTNDMIFAIDKNLKYISFNQNHKRFMKKLYNTDIKIGQNVLKFIDNKNDVEIAEKNIKRSLNGEQFISYREKEVNGINVFFEISYNPIKNNDEILGTAIFFKNVTLRKIVESELFEEKERAQITLKSISEGIIATNKLGKIEYLNPAAEKITGYKNIEAYGININSICSILSENKQKRVDILSIEKNEHLKDYILIDKKGKEINIKKSVSKIKDGNDNETGYVLVISDITLEKKLSRQILYQSEHDSLTGLVNRREFEKRLHNLIEKTKVDESKHSLLYFDLDQFKIVNDTSGHVAGDELLRQISLLLKEYVKKNDTLARLGGDEFAVILNLCDSNKAISVAKKIKEIIQSFRFGWEEKTFVIGVSMGIVEINKNSKDMNTVLSYADSSCYEAKDKGRNRIHLFKENDEEIIKRHGEMQWISKIQKAIENEKLCLFYQPIVPINPDYKNESHAEILVRMIDHNGEIIPPGAFIPAAERYNYMSTIDKWVIRNSLQKIAAQKNKNIKKYAINISGQSLSEEKFLSFVINEIKNSEVKPSKLCFEITETIAISNLVNAKKFIQSLKNIGCFFSLDDFGSGLSSFAYLKALPVDYLKIDGIFVKDMPHDPVDFAMVSAINQIGKVMGMRTIAEFVDSYEIIKKLKEINVDYIQGYIVAKPKKL